MARAAEIRLLSCGVSLKSTQAHHGAVDERGEFGRIGIPYPKTVLLSSTPVTCLGEQGADAHGVLFEAREHTGHRVDHRAVDHLQGRRPHVRVVVPLHEVDDPCASRRPSGRCRRGGCSRCRRGRGPYAAGSPGGRPDPPEAPGRLGPSSPPRCAEHTGSGQGVGDHAGTELHQVSAPDAWQTGERRCHSLRPPDLFHCVERIFLRRSRLAHAAPSRDP